MSQIETLRELAEQAADMGATLKNVEMDVIDGEVGLKLIKPGSEFEMSVPPEMLLGLGEIELATLKLSKNSSVSAGLKPWFEAYLSALITDEGREKLADLRKGIEAANLEASTKFRGLGLANFLTTNVKPEALNRALLARHVVGTAKGPVLLPVMGAARQGSKAATLSITAGGSFRAAGKEDDEVCISAGRFDALHALNTQGRALSFSTSFSVPLNLPLPDGRKLSIGRQFTETQKSDKVIIPKSWEEGDTIKLSFCPMGMKGQPRAPREVMKLALKPFAVTSFDESWSRIRSYNMSRLFEAYVAAKEIEHEALRNVLSEALASQIETLLESI